MFDNYCVESGTGNHIYLEFSAATLTKALSNTKTARTVSVKLSCYRGVPGLLFDMEVRIVNCMLKRCLTELIYDKIFQ